MITAAVLNRKYDRARKLAIRAGALSESMSRLGTPLTNQATGLTSGQEYLIAMPLLRGNVITSITFVSGSTGAATPTNQWFTLRDPSLNLLGVTADDTNTAWAASTEKRLNLASQVVVPADGLYMVGIMVAAATVPTLLGLVSSTVLDGLAPLIAVKSTSTAHTNPASAQAQITAYSQSAMQPYAYVS